MRHDTPQYIKRWPGYVVLPDALNYSQLLIWQDAIDAMIEANGDEPLTWDAAAANPRTAQHIVTALCALVNEWHLDGLPERITADLFPATPRVQSVLLIAWLCGVVASLYAGEDDTPEKKGE